MTRKKHLPTDLEVAGFYVGALAEDYGVMEELAIQLARLSGFVRADWSARRSVPLPEATATALDIIDRLAQELHMQHDLETK